MFFLRGDSQHSGKDRPKFDFRVTIRTSGYIIELVRQGSVMLLHMIDT